jgi:hypothetical protein
MGGRVDAMHLQYRWPFMPHFGSRDVEAGVFDEIEELQGQRSTYYAGSLLAFELVECSMAYAQELAERFFPSRPAVASPR